MTDCEVFELPWLPAIRHGQIIKAVPFHIKFIWKFWLVFSGLFLDVEFKGRDYLFHRWAVTCQRIDYVGNARFAACAEDNLSLLSHPAIAGPTQFPIGSRSQNRVTQIDQDRRVVTVGSFRQRIPRGRASWLKNKGV